MASAETGWQTLVVPGAVPMSWLAYADEQGLPVRDIAEQAGLAAEQAASFSAGVSLDKFLRLMQAVHAYAGDDSVGFEVGWRMPPTTFGSLGHALMSSATVGDGLIVLQRFWQLIARGIVLDVDLREDRGALSLFMQFPLSGVHRRIALDAIVISLYRGIMLLAPEAAKRIEIWFDYPEPDEVDRLRERLPRVHFGMPITQCRFPIELLDTPIPMASVAGKRAALQQCELEERLLNLQGTLTARVQRELGYRAGGFPTIEQFAAPLAMTPRTLRRRLLEEGTNYSALLDAVRLRDAVMLLEKPGLDIARIAEHLGYNDAANFTRAFRKWTGQTPSQYRAAMGG